ncbi:MAG: hypothetical protein IPK21_15385 [Haliscomenobacter sp.]|nr:hypothetical protein [Haliscomenobacter sp.]
MTITTTRGPHCRDLGIITPGNPVQLPTPHYREIITRILNRVSVDGINQDLAQTSGT